jgi:hypothetical protein
MNYIIIGLLLSIGWQVADVIFTVLAELVMSRLHNTDWYLVLAGKKPKAIEECPGDAKQVKCQIGFNYIEES